MKINGQTAYRCLVCCDRAVWIGEPDDPNAGAWYCDNPNHDEQDNEAPPHDAATATGMYDY